MRRVFVVLATLTLAACGPAVAPSGEPQDTGPAMPADQQPVTERQELSCAMFANVTQQTLPDLVGAENITTERLPGAEGEDYLATVVYANDPARRIEIVFTNMHALVAAVSVKSPNSTWIGPEGVTIGALMPEVERANGRAFKLWGFGWDYGGWVSNWNGGALDRSAENCRVTVRFDPDEGYSSAVSGDSELSSDAAAVRATTARVSEFGVTFIRPE